MFSFTDCGCDCDCLLFSHAISYSYSHISGNMPENPLQALFHNIEQVSSFVQHHLSNFIGIHFQPSGPHSGSLLSISSSTKAPLAKTASSVQLGDTAVKVFILSILCNLNCQNFYCDSCASECVFRDWLFVLLKLEFGVVCLF